MTVGEYLEKWLRLRAQALAPRTVENYKRLIKKCQVIHHIELEKLTVWDVETPIAAELDAGHGRTAEQVFVLLRTALGDAERIHTIPTSPVDKLLKPRLRREPHEVWTEEETRAFYAAAMKDKQAVGLLLPLLCGLRRGEVLGLTWEDVDMTANVLHIRRQLVQLDNGVIMMTPPKSEAGKRDVPFPDVLRPFLASARGIGGRVVPLSPSGLRTALRRACERAGVRCIGLHGLRHTFATNAVRHGGDMRSLQVVMGHASYTTTATVYTHPDMCDFKTIIAQSMRVVV